jgi:hypothetical protein
VVDAEQLYAILCYFEQVLDRPDYDRLMAAINGFTEVVATLHDVERRAAVAGLSPAQFLQILLLLVVTVGLLLAEAEMSVKAQGIITNEIANVGLAIVVADRIMRKD